MIERTDSKGILVRGDGGIVEIVQSTKTFQSDHLIASLESWSNRDRSCGFLGSIEARRTENSITLEFLVRIGAMAEVNSRFDQFDMRLDVLWD